jgi:hypothetical protein
MLKVTHRGDREQRKENVLLSHLKHQKQRAFTLPGVLIIGIHVQTGSARVKQEG